MSGIRSTSGSTPQTPVDTGRSTSAANQQVTPVSATSPSGGQSNPAVPQASSASSLSEGAMLAAIVTARATGGDTMLHTEVGNFRMASRSPIPVGSHVVLEVEAHNDVISARVVAINGEKLASPPTVTLLPVVQADPNKPDLYAMAAKLATPDKSENLLQNITTALAPTAKHAPQAGSLLSPQAAAAATSNANAPAKASATTSGPTANNSLLTASLTAGLTAKTGSASASHSAAAYAHTTTPGPRTTTTTQPTTPLPGTTAQTAGANNPSGTATPTTRNELVRATVDMPPINQRLIRAAGMADITSGTKLTLVTSSAAAPATLTPELTKNVATGIVISLSGPVGAAGTAKKMQVHVQSPELGTLRFTSGNPPVPGTQLSLSLSEKLSLFPLMPLDASSGAIKIPHMALLSDWENLRAAMNLLAAQDPGMASQLLGSRIPSANANLGASLLFFISALNGGGVAKWFGSGFTQALEKSGHGDLLKSLSDDFSVLSRLNSDPAGNDWKALIFPFFGEDKLHQLRMFYRKHGRNGEEGPEDETRFLIELDLTKSGPVQLDGLFRPKHFDLVFRHQQELAADLKNHVLDIFRENMEITGMIGGLTFRKTTPFPIHPTEEWEARAPRGQEA